MSDYRPDTGQGCADRAERGEVAARLTREHSLAALAARVRRVGQEDDPVTRSTRARLAALGAAEPPATVRAIRALAIELVRLSAPRTGRSGSLPSGRSRPRSRPCRRATARSCATSPSKA